MGRKQQGGKTAKRRASEQVAASEQAKPSKRRRANENELTEQATDDERA